MDENRRQAVAFFRYQVIAPLLNKDAGEPMKNAIARLAANYYNIPGCEHPRQISAKTIEEWLYLYRKSGHEALKPAKRKDAGESKAINDAIGEIIEQMLTERPELDGPNVLKELVARGLIAEGELSLSSFYRFRKARNLTKQWSQGTTFRAYEFDYPCDCFQTDVLYGPNLPGKDGKCRRTYLIAVIDDCTRVIAHGQFYFDQNLGSFLDTLKQALMKRGTPRRLYLDNAFVFRSNHLLRITAALGIHLIHSRPYQPEGRAKIERYFRTVRTQFLSRIDPGVVQTLEELNSLFWAWLEGEYHVRKHRTLDEAPLDKWLRLAQYARPLPQVVDLDVLFMHQVERRVCIDGTFQVDKVRFEAPLDLVGQKVQVHYDPNDLRKVYLSCQDQKMGLAYPLDAQANSRVSRDPRPESKKAESQLRLQSLYRLREQYQEVKHGNAENHPAAN